MIRLWVQEYSESIGSVEMLGMKALSGDDFLTYLCGDFIPCLRRHLVQLSEEDLQQATSTQFSLDYLQEDIRQTRYLDKPKLGQLLATCYLQQTSRVELPWSVFWDEKNARESGAGADIIGFSEEDGSTFFAFGEVKTTSDGAPPRCLYGKDGLISQLVSLQGKRATYAIHWLYIRCSKLGKIDRFMEALKQHKDGRYKIHGLLVKDTQPDRRDLDVVLQRYSNSSSPKVVLIALYIQLPFENCLLELRGRIDMTVA